MQVIETLSGAVKISKGSVLTVGNFDGVHIGHREILMQAARIAEQKQAELVVMTFEPHPLSTLDEYKGPDILTPLVLKKQLLGELGVNRLFVVNCTSEFLKLSPADFVRQYIVKSVRPSIVIEGENFNFGCRRTGNIHTLRNLGADAGIEVIAVEQKQAGFSIGHSVKISSTLIRSMVASGIVSDAAVALGRPYRLIGKIIRGRGKGKELGFPTLNMERPGQLVPAEGVYAGFVGIADTEEAVCKVKGAIPAAFSIGRSATLADDRPVAIEAHLLKADVGELVGKWMAMDFVKNIREQKKFNSDAELSAQIAKDCEQAKEILAQ